MTINIYGTMFSSSKEEAEEELRVWQEVEKWQHRLPTISISYPEKFKFEKDAVLKTIDISEYYLSLSKDPKKITYSRLNEPKLSSGKSLGSSMIKMGVLGLMSCSKDYDVAFLKLKIDLSEGQKPDFHNCDAVFDIRVYGATYARLKIFDAYKIEMDRHPEGGYFHLKDLTYDNPVIRTPLNDCMYTIDTDGDTLSYKGIFMQFCPRQVINKLVEHFTITKFNSLNIAMCSVHHRGGAWLGKIIKNEFSDE